MPTTPLPAPDLFGGRLTIDDFQRDDWCVFRIRCRERGRFYYAEKTGRVEGLDPSRGRPMDQDVLRVRCLGGDAYNIRPSDVIEKCDPPADLWWSE